LYYLKDERALDGSLKKLFLTTPVFFTPFYSLVKIFVFFSRRSLKRRLQPVGVCLLPAA
jgi:hypothetical protein